MHELWIIRKPRHFSFAKCSRPNSEKAFLILWVPRHTHWRNKLWCFSVYIQWRNLGPCSAPPQPPQAAGATSAEYPGLRAPDWVWRGGGAPGTLQGRPPQVSLRHCLCQRSNLQLIKIWNQKSEPEYCKIQTTRDPMWRGSPVADSKIHNARTFDQ